VLALAVIPGINSNTTLSDLTTNLQVDTSSGKVTVTDAATKEEKALAAYLNLIADDTGGKFSGNPITSGIKDAFGVR
ncbi:MAG: hypothetical protein LBC88_00660, partial [Spirochaetaceae bacterium]|jgi:hypothetical protein|nr:hypothetical protein [Spirochaetaceae bacterium]